MKTLIFCMSFFFVINLAYGQKQLLSYEDLKYLIENNLQNAGDFLSAKGYAITIDAKKKKGNTYSVVLPGGTKSTIALRADGKPIFVEINTDNNFQYNIIHNSVAPFLLKNTDMADIQTYVVKDLGTIYISVNDTEPYSPIKKDYDIHLIADKHIVS